MRGMRRRDLMISGVAVLAGFPPAAAQQPMARIGILLPENPEPFMSMFRDRLRELGYVEGRNALIEFRSAEGRQERLAALAAEIVRLKVDVIVTMQTPATAAAAKATRDIPIVMAGAGDPVGTGLIASLARPGGNITGVAGQNAEVAAKLLELMREALPTLRRVAILANPSDPFTKLFLDQLDRAAKSLVIDAWTVMIRGAEDIDGAFARFARHRPDAVLVQPSLPRRPVIDNALKHRFPAISSSRLFAEEGGLLGYSASIGEIYRMAAVYTGKILKGIRPADLPVEQPTKFDFIINLKTAKALGIAIPQSLLERAQDLIE